MHFEDSLQDFLGIGCKGEMRGVGENFKGFCISP